MQSIPVHSIEQFAYAGMNEDFYASKISSHLDKHGHIGTPRIHASYTCILVSRGTGTLTIDLITHYVKPGCVFLIQPGQVDSWEETAKVDGYVICHTADFYNLNSSHVLIDQFPFFSSETNSQLIIVKTTEREQIKRVFQDIVGLYEIKQSMRVQQLFSLLNVLYIRLSQLYPHENEHATHNQHAQIHALETLIEDNYKTSKFPWQYASLMNMSTKHLNRIVKLKLNKTTSILISDRIILEAKRMLLHSSLSVSEIAFELGYLDNAYFFRFFKRKNGNTPVQFLNKFRKT